MPRKGKTAKRRKKAKARRKTVRKRVAIADLSPEQLERLRWKFYRSIPQKHWRKMSGRDAKIINSQAKKYGIPFNGGTIDLPAVVKAIHDFFAKNWRGISAGECTDDGMLDGQTSPALERWREERAIMAKLERLKMQGELLDRAAVRETFARASSVLRSMAAQLQRDYGPGAHELYNEGLDQVERLIFPMTEPDGESKRD